MSALSGRRLAMYIGLCAVWGSTWLVIKIGLRDLPPLWFGAIRMALACALLAPFAFARGASQAGRGRWKLVVFSGLLQIGVNYACVFLAEERALGEHWEHAFAGRPRFVPGGHGGH